MSSRGQRRQQAALGKAYKRLQCLATHDSNSFLSRECPVHTAVGAVRIVVVAVEKP